MCDLQMVDFATQAHMGWDHATRGVVAAFLGLDGNVAKRMSTQEIRRCLRYLPEGEGKGEGDS